MFSKHFTVLHWVVLRGIIAIMSYSTMTEAGSVAAIIAAVCLVGGIIYSVCKWRKKRQKLQDLMVHYLIPQSKYPNASFIGAPEQEEKPEQLIVGIGTYRLMHVITPKTDILIDPIILRFEGANKNIPKRYGTDNPFVVEILNDGSYRDWWGDVQPPPENWPRYLHYGDTLVIGNRIETVGQWSGKAYFEFRVRNEPVIIKKLGFTVSENPQDDQIPFLKIVNPQEPTRLQSPTNTAQPYSL